MPEQIGQMMGVPLAAALKLHTLSSAASGLYAVLCALQDEPGFCACSTSALRKLFAEMPERTFYRAKKELMEGNWINETSEGFSLLVGFEGNGLPKMAVTAKNGSDGLPKMAVTAKNGSEGTAKNGSDGLPKMAVTAKNGSDGLPKMAGTAKNGSEGTAKNGSENAGKEEIYINFPSSLPAGRPDADEDQLEFGDYLEYLTVKKRKPEHEVLALANRMFEQGSEAAQVRTWRDRQRQRESAAMATASTTPTPAPEITHSPIWRSTLDTLAELLPSEVVQSWFATLNAIQPDEKTLRITAPDDSFADWIKQNYQAQLDIALSANGLGNCAVEWIA